jgi:hypothetical protein
VLDSAAERRLSQEALDSRGVVAEALFEDFDGAGSTLGMLGSIHGSRTALAYALEQSVCRNRTSGEIFLGHASGRK